MFIKEIDYSAESVQLKGFCVQPRQDSRDIPAVLVAPAWAGRDSFACEQAERIAKLGYVGFALDVYGDARVGTSKEENATLMTPLVENRSLLLLRLRAALATVQKLEAVDAKRVAAIGFCFGGLCVLDMTRANCGLRAAVSFHGILSPPDHQAANDTLSTISTKVLVLHGHDDPMVPPQQVQALQQELSEHQADWQVHTFGGAKHAFTNPEANDPDFGTVYHPVVANRSWPLAEGFLQEVLT